MAVNPVMKASVTGSVPDALVWNDPIPGQPGVGLFVRLKLRLVRNSLRGENLRAAGVVVGIVAGVIVGGSIGVLLTASGLAPADVGFSIAVFGGSAMVVGWSLLPTLFFGVDETLDPARFALLPLRRGVLLRGMFAAAFLGIPAAATAFASLGLVAAAAIRWGLAAAVVALAGVAVGLSTCVLASRALTSALAQMLRSRRTRDLAIVAIALLAGAVAPLQIMLSRVAQTESPEAPIGAARVLAWTPLGAPFALPYDVAGERWGQFGVRVAVSLSTIGLLLWWWSRTIESAMVASGSGGGSGRGSGTAKANAARKTEVAAAGGLLGGVLGWLPRTRFGAIVALQSRYWWRDPRRRSAIVSLLVVTIVFPFAMNLPGASGPAAGSGSLIFAAAMAGMIAGLLLVNQFGYDGTAYAAHVLAGVPGRVELGARAVAMSLVAVPVESATVVAVAIVAGGTARLPSVFGVLAAVFGAGVACSSVLSVLAAYAMPESRNPFATSTGSGTGKGFLGLVAMVATPAIASPVLIVAAKLGSWGAGVAAPWLTLALGATYGLAAAWLGIRLGGSILDRRIPEVLAAVTPRR